MAGNGKGNYILGRVMACKNPRGSGNCQQSAELDSEKGGAIVLENYSKADLGAPCELLKESGIYPKGNRKLSKRFSKFVY